MIRTATTLLAGQDVASPELAERIDRAIREVLANPPYRDGPNLLERLVQWAVERLGSGLSGPALDVLAWIVRGIVWVAVAALVGLVGWLAWRRLRGAPGRRPGGAGPTTTHGRVEPSAADWLAEAHRAAAAGDHRAAVRAAYRAVVVHLVAAGAVPARAGATVGAHRAAIRTGSALEVVQARGFDRASDVFERVWYADGPATGADAATVLAAAEALGVDR